MSAPRVKQGKHLDTRRTSQPLGSPPGEKTERQRVSRMKAANLGSLSLFPAALTRSGGDVLLCNTTALITKTDGNEEADISSD